MNELTADLATGAMNRVQANIFDVDSLCLLTRVPVKTVKSLDYHNQHSETVNVSCYVTTNKIRN